MQNPLPATAQVAYQQGAAIARNLKAISAGGSPSPAQVRLRGTLLKLGPEESAAEIFDRFEIKDNLGHLIRQAAYLELLPTPVENFKATTEWLADEVFHRLTGH
jgi:NADH dehydrogenase